MVAVRLGGWWPSPLPRALVVGLAYFALAELGHALTLQTAAWSFAIFWPPAGLLIAVLALTPPRHWPGLLLAAFTALFTSSVCVHAQPITAGLGFCLASGVEACLGAWLLRRFGHGPATRTRTEHVLALYGSTALIASLLGALLGAATLHSTRGLPFGPVLQAWWAADALGILVIALVIFAWASGRDAARSRRGPVLETVLVFAGMSLAAEAVYGEWLPPPLLVPAYILPCLLWAALRLGPRGAATGVLVVALIGAAHTALGQGPYAALSASPAERLLRSQAALFILSVSVTVLAAVVAERKRLEQERIRLISELEQTLAENRTLRGLVPICAWCKKVRDEAGDWQRLETYLCEHTDATPTHGICPDCLTQQTEAVMAARSEACHRG